MSNCFLFLLLIYLATLLGFVLCHGLVPLSWPFVVDLNCSSSSLCDDLHVTPHHNSLDQLVLVWRKNNLIQMASFTSVVDAVPTFNQRDLNLIGRPLGVISLTNDTVVMFYRVVNQLNFTWYWSSVSSSNVTNQFVEYQSDVSREDGAIVPLPNNEFVLFWAHEHTSGGSEGIFAHITGNGTTSSGFEWEILPGDSTRVVDIALTFTEDEGIWVTVALGRAEGDSCQSCRFFFVVRDQFDNVLSNVSYFLGMNISNVDSLLLSNSTLVVAATVNNVSIWVGIFDLNGTLILGQIVSSSVPNVIHGVPAISEIGCNEGFVVVWYALEHEGTYTPADGWGVYGRVFTNRGIPVGNEFRINGWPHQEPWPNHKPALGSTFNGDFYVFWLDSDVGIFGRRFAHRICPLVPLNQTFCDHGLGCNFVTCQCDEGFQSNNSTFSCDPLCSSNSYSPGTLCFSGGGFGCNGSCQCNPGYQESIPPQTNCIPAPNQEQATALGSAFSITNTNDTLTTRMTPTLVKLTDGNIAVIWVEGLELHGQILDTYGRPIGNTFHVLTANESTHVGLYLPVAAAMSNAFVVAWIEDDGTANHTHVRLFFNTGDPLTAEIDVDNSYSSNNSYTMAPSIAVYDNDNFVVVWGSDGKVLFRVFDHHAMPLSMTRQALAGLGGVISCSYAASASILPGSQTLVLLLEVNPPSGQPEIWWQLFNTSFEEIARGYHTQGSHPAVTGFQLGGIDYFAVASWSLAPHALGISLYNANGSVVQNATYPVFELNDPNLDLYTTRIDRFPSGSFVVLFTSYDSQGSLVPNQPQGKLIRSNFSVVLNSGQPFSVNSTGFVAYFPSNALTIVNNNQFFVAWAQQDNQIYLQALTGFNAPSVTPTPPPTTPPTSPPPTSPPTTPPSVPSVNAPISGTPQSVPSLSTAQPPTQNPIAASPQQPPIYIPLSRAPRPPVFSRAIKWVPSVLMFLLTVLLFCAF